MKFTDKKIQNLKPKAQRYEEWEGNGFGVRVTPRGTRSFVCLFRFEGKPRRLTLGTYPNMTLAEAHQAHGEAMKKLEQRIDPGAITVAEREEDRQAPTVATLVEEYIERWAKARKKSWKVDRRILYKDVLPQWGRRKAQDITRRDVIRLLDNIVDRGAPIIANRTLAVIRKMFNFAVNRDIIPTSPCIGIQAPTPENRRDRVLTPEEIKAFWQGLDKTRVTAGIRLALKLQLVTGQRKGEIINAPWEELDLSTGWWTIPAKQTKLRLTHNVQDGLAKNKLPHRVFLAPMAVELLQRVKALSGDSPWLFPSPRGNKPITGAAVDHALRLALNSLEMEHFTPHDLRRSAATFMTGSCGIPRLVVSKILNHAEPHITAVYDRASYDKEKQMALEAWGRKLQAIIEGTKSNVVSMIRGV
jgi:integrase